MSAQNFNREPIVDQCALRSAIQFQLTLTENEIDTILEALRVYGLCQLENKKEAEAAQLAEWVAEASDLYSQSQWCRRRIKQQQYEAEFGSR